MSQSNKNKKLIKGKNGEIGYTVDTSYAANSGTDRLLPSVNSNGNQSPLTYSNFLADANGAAPTSTLVSGSVGNNYSVARTKFSSETGGEVGGETGAEPGSEAPANDLSYLEYKKGVGEKLTEEHQDILDEIEKARQQNITYAENVKSDAYSKAMSNEKKALIDSENSYARNLSAYGAKADALASMGLSGSGYSEFLDSQAYAAHRNDVNAAMAQRSESERAADTAYNDALYGINTETDKAIREENSAYRTALATNENEIMTYKEGMFNNVLKGIQDGTYSKEQIAELAGLYEFTTEQQAMLNSAADEYATLKKEKETEISRQAYSDIYADIYANPLNYDESIIDNAAGLLETEATKLKEELKTARDRAVNELIFRSSSMIDLDGVLDEVDLLLKNGKIDSTAAQGYYKSALEKAVGFGRTESEDLALISAIDKAVKAGKLEESAAESIKKTLYDDWGFVVPADKIDFDEDDYSINGEDYDTAEDKLPQDLATMLTDVAKSKVGDLKTGTVVRRNGVLYLYNEDGRWVSLVYDGDGQDTFGMSLDKGEIPLDAEEKAARENSEASKAQAELNSKVIEEIKKRISKSESKKLSNNDYKEILDMFPDLDFEKLLYFTANLDYFDDLENNPDRHSVIRKESPKKTTGSDK